MVDIRATNYHQSMEENSWECSDVSLHSHFSESFQLGLVEREINALLRGRTQQDSRQKRNVAKAKIESGSANAVSNGKEVLPQREITQEDVCPICQDEFLATREPVTYCRYGVRRHRKYLKIIGNLSQLVAGRCCVQMVWNFPKYNICSDILVIYYVKAQNILLAISDKFIVILM